jgi:hypothetical protein
MVELADYRELVRNNGGAKAFIISKLRAVFCISRGMLYLFRPHAACHRLDRLRSSLRN